MDATLDRLSLIFGRPLTGPLNLLVNLVWWIVFILGMTSLWPWAYRALEGLVRLNGLNITLPPPLVIVPLMVVLTLILIVHAQAIERRARLTATDQPG